MSPGIQVFWERVGVCAGLFFFCERDVCERDAREACAACRRGFVGGWLLGCRNSAKSVLQKSELASLKQRTFVKQRRFPPAKNQLPSCRVSQNRCTLHGWLFRAGGIGWLLGSWMSRQRCAGRLGEKAEFPCVFLVGGEDVGLWDNFWNSFG